MLIIGCDYHPGFQQIACVDTDTGELSERRLAHREQAEQFYRELKQRNLSARVGMESSGHARWFERLLHELGFELWIGDPAEIRTKRVRKQKTDRQDAQLLLRLMLENRFPRIWVPDENRAPSLPWRSSVPIMNMFGSFPPVEQRDAEAMRWYLRAAAEGFAPAENNVGYMYETGRARENASGSSLTDDEATKWYRKAAESGSAAGDLNLGRVYLNGIGIRQDFAAGVKWFRKAVAHGSAAAWRRDQICVLCLPRPSRRS